MGWTLNLFVVGRGFLRLLFEGMTQVLPATSKVG